MEGINGTQHPLQTPIILECIFEHLEDTKDLKVCREVCKAWRDASRTAMRASTQVTIRGNESNPREISKFLELVESEESTFFQEQGKPLADHFILTGGNADSLEFWKAAGSHIKSLKIFDAEFPSADSFRHAIFQSCPNLEQLELGWVKVLGERDQEPKEWVPPKHCPNANLKSLEITDGEFSITCLEILSNFASLEKLAVNEIVGSLVAFFNALEIARQHDATCWNLKDVEISGGSETILVPASFTRIFGGGDLTLTSLKICEFAGDTQEEVVAVQNILAAHAPTLKELDLAQNIDEYPEMDIFPLPGNQMLENVEVLELIGIKWRSPRFLQAFPNVKKLTLEVDEIPEDLQTPHVILKDCTHLTLFNRIGTTEEFERVLNLLPNVKILSISRMDNDWFSRVCQAWPNLTHLQLFDGIGLDDMGLTGYDKKAVRKINRKGRKSSWRPISVRRANLTSLKNLQSFWWKLRSEEYSKLGCCSVVCGVLELQELKYLCVERDNREEESLPLFDNLASKFTWNKTQAMMFE